jgi:hypothetical protein
MGVGKQMRNGQLKGLGLNLMEAYNCNQRLPNRLNILRSIRNSQLAVQVLQHRACNEIVTALLPSGYGLGLACISTPELRNSQPPPAPAPFSPSTDEHIITLLYALCN